MEYQKRSNGLQTFLEHGGLAFTAIVAFLTMQVFDFLTCLHGTPLVCFCVISFTLLILGGTLIGYAKFPVYRNGRFLTFGLKSVPPHLSGYYRRGWGVFLFGVALTLCLLLSKPF